MDLFVLPDYSLRGGNLIQEIDSVLWIERYREPGEFKITCPPSQRMLTDIPIGSFISHIDTREVMIVESHEINEPKNGRAVLTISGRSILSFFENRLTQMSGTGGGGGVVNFNQVEIEDPPGTYKLIDVPNEMLLSGTSRNTRVAEVLKNSLYASNGWVKTYADGLNYAAGVNGATFSIYNILTDASVPSFSGVIPLKRQSALATVLELLEMTDSGIKITRPMFWGDLGGSTLTVHNGVDLSSTIHFDWAEGDLADGKYLWSNRGSFNGAIAIGQYWSDAVIPSGKTGYDSRYTYLDATDYAQRDSTIPSVYTYMSNILKGRATEFLAGTQSKKIVEATATKNSRHIFRKNYNIGDFVGIMGNYNINSVMRVIEHTEFEDENGESSYPTFSNEY